MVFTTALRFVRSRGPDEFWRKRRILRLSSHFQGRIRNCYGLAIRIVHRSLVYATKGRRLRRQDRAALWDLRVDAGSKENGVVGGVVAMRDGLDRTRVALDRRSLSDLAAWEGRSFSALAALARFATGQSTEPLGRLLFRNRIS